MFKFDRRRKVMNSKYNFNKIFCTQFTMNRLVIFCISLTIISVFPLKAGSLTQVEKIDIAKVWAGHPVNFAIRTKNNLQCVVYYDTAQQMIVAARTPGETIWKYTPLKTKVGWDSHNYIDMAIDDSGYIHVSGNMHNVNLIYFRSKKPWSIEAFEQPGMVGTLETRVTYPVFIEGPRKKLLFQYRIGGSGDGVTIWNGYDIEKKKWYRITEKGLFDNTGSVNAYSTPPALGPDGCFHIVWMWRNSPVANTNHDLSHMKSSDLINWKNMAGKTVAIPVGQYNKDVVVDPISSGHGLINMDFWISWDTRNRAVVTYHRYDNGGYSQIFNTRWENDHWKIYQTSDWQGIIWNLNREGSLSHDIAATPLSIDEKGNLVQNYVYPKDKNTRQWVLDEATLKPKIDGAFQPPAAMKELYSVESPFNGMQVNRIQDGEYYIKWESMPINQDRARTAGTYPSSSMLRLYRFATPTATIEKQYPLKNKIFSVEKNRLQVVSGNFPDNKNCLFNVALYSLDGQEIFTKIIDASNQNKISITGIPKGVYVVQVHENRSKNRLLSERISIY